jgi:hypothetical protein
MRWLLIPALLLAGCATTPAPSPSSPSSNGPRDELRVVYEQNFEAQQSLKDFDFSDLASWIWSEDEAALELVGVGSYQPLYRSPASLAILKDLELDDFVLEAELKQTGRNYGHRDMCLFFGYVSPTRYYYVHLAPAPDQNAHNVFIVDDAPRRNLSDVLDEGLIWQDGVWHHVRLERRGDNIRVYVDHATQPTLEASDDTIATGRVGFGSFDDSGMIRNIKVWTRDGEEDSPRGCGGGGGGRGGGGTPTRGLRAGGWGV